MSREILILREPEIRSLLDPEACILAMERAFAAYSTGQAELPSVIHLDVPEHKGEIHIKAGYIRGGDYYAAKIVSGFSEQSQALDWPRTTAWSLCSTRKLARRARFLLDNGFITDMRTGRGGGVRGEASGAKTALDSGGYRNRRAGAISGGDAGRGKKFQRGAHLGTRSA